MPDLLDRDTLTTLRVGGDERLARAELRRQIGRLEHQLSRLAVEAFPRVAIDTAVAGHFAEPRVAGLDELEQVRDALAERIGAARAALQEQGELETSNRELLRRMLATRPSTSGCGSRAPTSASPAAGTGTPAPASARWGC